MFSIEHTYTRIKPNGMASWNKCYLITGPISFSISTTVGNCCAMNMMENVPAELWRKLFRKEEYIAPLKEFLQQLKESRYHESWDNHLPNRESRPSFRIGQLFYTQNSFFDDEMSPEFVKMFDWQGESEPGHRTSMFMFSF